MWLFHHSFHPFSRKSHQWSVDDIRPLKCSSSYSRGSFPAPGDSKYRFYWSLQIQTHPSVPHIVLIVFTVNSYLNLYYGDRNPQWIGSHKSVLYWLRLTFSPLGFEGDLRWGIEVRSWGLDCTFRLIEVLLRNYVLLQILGGFREK